VTCVRAVLAIAILVSVSCAGDGRGVILDAEGRFVPNTAERYRDHQQAAIVERLDQHGIIAAVTIDELPTWRRAFHTRGEGWCWDRVHVTVRHGSETVDADAVAALVRQRLLAHVERQQRITVDLVHAAVEQKPVQHRTYVVQRGDTLAQISLVHYGRSEDWRRIVTANPDVDFEPLAAGTVLLVPP
jgi:hypothetical protein